MTPNKLTFQSKNLQVDYIPFDIENVFDEDEISEIVSYFSNYL